MQGGPVGQGPGAVGHRLAPALRRAFARVPGELIERPQWVAWKYELRGGKPTKLPYNAATGELAGAGDPRRGGAAVVVD